MTQSLNHQAMILDQIPIPGQLLASYTRLGLDEKELIVILQLYRFLYNEIAFPTPGNLAEHVNFDVEECSAILRKLVQRNLLDINETKNEYGQLSETFSLNPLWKKLYEPQEKDTDQHEGTLFILFEQEFGRPLSPFEIETVNIWLDEDHMKPALIKAALRESVLMGKLNFKYIDRILREWKKKGIHTVDQARQAGRAFHDKQKKDPSQPAQKRDTSIYYNWLEGED
ncbi:DNA replication protein DnaD [Lentibacillus sp. JNUCC-1]|uniref:DnaD domain-containing protein n=1 Tax=Lentibacillus sp. JNUCC-1 TaxID=2654513 RepID=UPI0012E8CB49|nr:DnaD domain-containing protein [Lentibacillus sp. JNUCC-1]MUV39801.1 DNA replication protein DnaD [Lentibacillus sp. JNUCC-1]